MSRIIGRMTVATIIVSTVTLLVLGLFGSPGSVRDMLSALALYSMVVTIPLILGAIVVAVTIDTISHGRCRNRGSSLVALFVSAMLFVLTSAEYRRIGWLLVFICTCAGLLAGGGIRRSKTGKAS